MRAMPSERKPIGSSRWPHWPVGIAATPIEGLLLLRLPPRNLLLHAYRREGSDFGTLRDCYDHDSNAPHNRGHDGADVEEGVGKLEEWISARSVSAERMGDQNTVAGRGTLQLADERSCLPMSQRVALAGVLPRLHACSDSSRRRWCLAWAATVQARIAEEAEASQARQLPPPDQDN